MDDLYSAAREGDLDKVHQLLDSGADVDQANIVGVTPLWIASEHGHKDVCALLLDRGADVDQADQAENTPLYMASKNGHREVCAVLLNRGANVNHADFLGETPLLTASENGHADVCALLIRHGAQTRGALGGDLDDSITDALCQRPLVDLRDTFVHRRVENLEHMIEIMRHVEFIVLDEQRPCDLFNKLVEEKVALRKNSIDDIRAAWVLEETNISPQVQNLMIPFLYEKMATILNDVPNGGIEELRAMKINRSDAFESYKHSIEIRFQMMLSRYKKLYQLEVQRRARERRARRRVKSATRPPPIKKKNLHEEMNALRF